MGGLAMGFPLLTGPISIFTALEQGADFASQAATTNLVGQVSTCVFCFVYACAALRYGAWVSAACGLVTFFIATAVWSQFHWPLAGAIALFMISLAGLNRAISKPPGSTPARAAPWWELPARMLVAGCFVFAITTASTRLGAQLSGLIAPFPVFVLILVVFTHLQDGSGAAVAMAKGVLLGSPAFGIFFIAVALGLPNFPIPVAYAGAAVLSVGFSAALLLFRMGRVRISV
jgi:hypothetical protein